MPHLLFHFEAGKQSAVAAHMDMLPQGAATSFTAIRNRACS
jgi:hypothetical protein